jgi:hypothetical protein
MTPRPGCQSALRALQGARPAHGSKYRIERKLEHDHRRPECTKDAASDRRRGASPARISAPGNRVARLGRSAAIPIPLAPSARSRCQAGRVATHADRMPRDLAFPVGRRYKTGWAKSQKMERALDFPLSGRNYPAHPKYSNDGRTLRPKQRRGDRATFLPHSASFLCPEETDPYLSRVPNIVLPVGTAIRLVESLSYRRLS